MMVKALSFYFLMTFMMPEPENTPVVISEIETLKEAITIFLKGQ